MSVKVETLEKNMAKLTIEVPGCRGGEGYAGSLFKNKE